MVIVVKDVILKMFLPPNHIAESTMDESNNTPSNNYAAWLRAER